MIRMTAAPYTARYTCFRKRSHSGSTTSSPVPSRAPKGDCTPPSRAIVNRTMLSPKANWSGEM